MLDRLALVALVALALGFSRTLARPVLEVPEVLALGSSPTLALQRQRAEERASLPEVVATEPSSTRVLVALPAQRQAALALEWPLPVAAAEDDHQRSGRQQRARAVEAAAAQAARRRAHEQVQPVLPQAPYRPPRLHLGASSRASPRAVQPR